MPELKIDIEQADEERGVQRGIEPPFAGSLRVSLGYIFVHLPGLSPLLGLTASPRLD
jgi:hypothetical protein